MGLRNDPVLGSFSFCYSECMKTLVKFLGTVVAVVLTVSLVPGVSIVSASQSDMWVTTFLVAVVWSVISMVIRPVLAILTLPITLLTFGLFSLILNALLFWLMASIVPGFHVAGFFAAFLGAIVLSLLSWLIHKALP